ncbi:MAG: hypothetical protein MAGBODY4_00338 [Candidatus Marinimicrobia bacterium]|nr:hypothetical protein [Candidatus Neomarinimicrobiota bacterium]
MALFRQHLVTDSGIDIIEILDALLIYEFPDDLMVVSEFFVGRRRRVIKHDYVFVRIVDLVHAQRVEFVGDIRGIIVTHRHIRLYVHKLASHHIFAALFTQYLFGKCFTHGTPECYGVTV